MKKKPIESAWQSYRQLVVPPGAPAVQIDESRKAFFSGAAILFAAVVAESSERTEDEAAESFSMIASELAEFGAQLDLEVLKRAGLQS